MKYINPNNHNQLSADLTGCGTGLSPWISCDSSSRLVMLGGQLSQMLVMEGSTPRRNITGVESDYANATFKAEMPVTGRILAVIPKFRRGLGKDQIDARSNPETVVIYENLEAKERGRLELGALTITSHHCTHPEFGFKFKQLGAQQRLLREMEIIPKGTCFTESPNVQPNGDYAYGIEAQVALMSIPQVIEDGIVISQDFAERCAVTSIGSRMITWGKKRYPLNMYGTPDEYRPFPEIGERIRPDGILFALRDYDEILACTDMTDEALMQHDVVFDKLFYGPPGAEITNITIMRDDKAMPITPETMLQQIRKYESAQKTFYQRINKTIADYRSKNRLNKVHLSPELHRLAVEAIREQGGLSTNVIKTYRASPLDEWSIEITFAHRQVPDVSFKFTDGHGGFNNHQ